MKLKSETVGFVRGGMLFLEPPWRWRVWQRDIWTCCAPNPRALAAGSSLDGVEHNAMPEAVAEQLIPCRRPEGST